MRIAMVGSGYVGLVSGACFADFGHDVVCVDKDAERIEALKQLRMPIYEPGLYELVEANARAGRLSFTTALADAVAAADVVFVAVGTPSRRGDGFADLSAVYQVAGEIAGKLSGYTVVTIKSTVPVGTGDEVERIIVEKNPSASVAVVSNPEFLREGSAIEDFKHPDRIVVGTGDERARETMAEVYRPVSLNRAPVLFTERRTAELIKYAANAFLATKITFINEIADLCEKLDVDVQDVARGVGLDRRIGSKFLHAGPGYGGSCLPKDTLALMKTAQDAAAPLRLVETAVEVNDARKRSMATRVIGALGGNVQGRRIGILGLSFKPNTDDVRDAPALSIIRGLQEAGASIVAHDPEGMEQAKALLEDVEWAPGIYECAEGASALVIVTEWDAFRALDFERLKLLMKSRVLVDLRNIYRAEQIAHHGFRYASVGRPREDVAGTVVEAAE